MAAKVALHHGRPVSPRTPAFRVAYTEAVDVGSYKRAMFGSSGPGPEVQLFARQSNTLPLAAAVREAKRLSRSRSVGTACVVVPVEREVYDDAGDYSGSFRDRGQLGCYTNGKRDRSKTRTF